MKINNYAKISAIAAAILFFILSTIKLISFAVNQGVLSTSDSNAIRLVMNNYKDLYILSTILLFLTFIIILSSYFIYFKKNNQNIAKYLTLLILISSTIFTISELSRYLNFLDIISLKISLSKTILSLSSLVFASALLFYKSNRKKALLIIAPLYIIQSIFTLSTNYLPVQLLDLTIAIRISESVFFHQESKNA